MKPIDKTGRDRIVRNLVARWLGQVVVIISGFVIPRQIDESLGATSLGIWDFGWSTVTYFRLFGFGLAGGLNRFVAFYNAEDDDVKLGRAVSTTVFMTIIISLVVATAAVGVAAMLGFIFDDISPEDLDESQLLVFFFGLTVAYRMLCWPARSILTGYHLTTVTSMVTAAGDLLLLIGLFVALSFGGGLAELGLIVLASTLLAETTRCFMARRVYTGPIMRRAFLDRKMMIKMFVFGMKNNVSGLPHILVVQSTSMVLAATAGPAALAVFARPLALCHLVGRLVRQYATLLTPVAGGMQGLKRHDDMKGFYLSSMRVSVAMTALPLMLLGAYGDAVIRVWMGEKYIVPWLCPLMSAAFFMSFAHSAAMRILAGVDAHGKVAIRGLVHSAVVYGIALAIAVNIGLDVLSAAVVIGLGMSVGPGLTTMAGACKRFDVGLIEYVMYSILPPLYCNLPLLVVILVSKKLNPDMSLASATAWGFLGSVLVLFCYWQFLLPDTMRAALAKRLPGFSRS